MSQLILQSFKNVHVPSWYRRYHRPDIMTSMVCRNLFGGPHSDSNTENNHLNNSWSSTTFMIENHGQLPSRTFSTSWRNYKNSNDNRRNKRTHNNHDNTTNDQDDGDKKKSDITSLRDAFLKQNQSWRNKNNDDNQNNNISTSKAFRERTKRNGVFPGRNNNNFNNRRNSQHHQSPLFPKSPNQKSIKDLQRSLLGNSINKTSTKKNSKDDSPDVMRGVKKKDYYSWMEISQMWRKKVVDIQEMARKELGINSEKMAYLDYDSVQLLAMEFGLDFQHDNLEEKEEKDETKEIEGESRPPVVCIMGHVDHGKTTLLDALRRMSYNHSDSTTNKNNKSNIGNTKKKKKGAAKKKNKKIANQSQTNDANMDNVAGTEAGGITQAISAFVVPFTASDQEDISTITFLDTPGHAAFRSMRQCGSLGADIVILVIAAKDGICEQTKEILKSHYGNNSSNLQLIVAMTKLDLLIPNLDSENGKHDFREEIDDHILDLEQELSLFFSAEFSSDIKTPMIVPTSAKVGFGLQELLETLDLIQCDENYTSEICENAVAKGIVLDSRKHSKLGIITDCIIRQGHVSRGDFFTLSSSDTGEFYYGKIRSLLELSMQQRNLVGQKAGPSQPVRLVGGFKSLPQPGDTIDIVSSEQVAKQIISNHEQQQQQLSSQQPPPLPNDDNLSATDTTNMELQVTGIEAKQRLMKQRRLKRYGRDDESLIEQPEDKMITIPIVLVADTNHTLEALKDCLESLQELHDLIDVNVISTNVSPIVTNNDLRIATDAGAAVFGFNVQYDTSSSQNLSLTDNLGTESDVTVECDDVIYRLMDRAKEIFGTYLPPVPSTVVHGSAKVQAIYPINNNQATVAGCMVQHGTMLHPSNKQEAEKMFYRIIRGDDKKIVAEKSTCQSLRRLKETVNSVRRGEECGIVLNGDFSAYKVNDIIECFTIEMKHITLK